MNNFGLDSKTFGQVSVNAVRSLLKCNQLPTTHATKKEVILTRETEMLSRALVNTEDTIKIVEETSNNISETPINFKDQKSSCNCDHHKHESAPRQEKKLINPLTFTNIKINETGDVVNANEIINESKHDTSKVEVSSTPVDIVNAIPTPMVCDAEPAVAAAIVTQFDNSKKIVEYNKFKDELLNIEKAVTELGFGIQFVEDKERIITAFVYNATGAVPESSFGIDINGVIFNKKHKIILGVPQFGIENNVMIPINQIDILIKYVTNNLDKDEAIQYETKVIQPMERLNLLIDIDSLPKNYSQDFINNLVKLIPEINRQIHTVDPNTRYQIYSYVDDTHFSLVSNQTSKSIRLYQVANPKKIYQSMTISPDKDDGKLSISYKSKNQ